MSIFGKNEKVNKMESKQVEIQRKVIVVQIVEKSGSVTESIVIGTTSESPYEILQNRLIYGFPSFIDRSNKFLTYFNKDDIKKIIVVKENLYEEKQ